MSHLGRPTEGEFDNAVFSHRRRSLSTSVGFVGATRSFLVERLAQLGVELHGGGRRRSAGERALQSQVRKARRRGPGPGLRRLVCDIFVMDAFGTAHRAQASTHGVARVCAREPVPARCSPVSCSALEQALAPVPARPMVAIVGGSKVSTKLTVLETLSDKVDQLVVGGGIANTFLAACRQAGGEVTLRARPHSRRCGADGKNQHPAPGRCRHRQGVLCSPLPGRHYKLAERGG